MAVNRAHTANLTVQSHQSFAKPVPGCPLPFWPAKSGGPWSPQSDWIDQDFAAPHFTGTWKCGPSLPFGSTSCTMLPAQSELGRAPAAPFHRSMATWQPLGISALLPCRYLGPGPWQEDHHLVIWKNAQSLGSLISESCWSAYQFLSKRSISRFWDQILH